MGLPGLRAIEAIGKASTDMQRWPAAWAMLQMLHNKKPGDKTGPQDNYRDIQVMDPSAKIYTGVFAAREAQGIHQKVWPTEYGFIAHRGTAQAVMHIHTASARLAKQGKQFATFMGDIRQAYPRARHGKLLKDLDKTANSAGTAYSIRLRYNTVFYAIQGTDGTWLCIKVMRGTVTRGIAWAARLRHHKP